MKSPASTARPDRGFSVSLGIRANGKLEFAYVKFADGPVDKTRSFLKAIVFVDIASSGDLIGVEIFGRLSEQKVKSVASQLSKKNRQRFLRAFAGEWAQGLLVGS